MIPPLETPRLMRKKWVSPLEGSSNANEENDSNMGVQMKKGCARLRTDWEGVNLSAGFLFTRLVLSFSTYHFSSL